jgi:hypothetical protein
VGAVVSTTVTSNVPLSPRPPESVTEHATVVVPSGRTSPAAGLQVGTGSGSSSASAAETPDQAAVQPPTVSPSIVTSSGRLRTGAVLPTTSSSNVTAGPARSAAASSLPASLTEAVQATV